MQNIPRIPKSVKRVATVVIVLVALAIALPAADRYSDLSLPTSETVDLIEAHWSCGKPVPQRSCRKWQTYSEVHAAVLDPTTRQEAVTALLSTGVPPDEAAALGRLSTGDDQCAQEVTQETLMLLNATYAKGAWTDTYSWFTKTGGITQPVKQTSHLIDAAGQAGITLYGIEQSRLVQIYSMICQAQ